MILLLHEELFYDKNMYQPQRGQICKLFSNQPNLIFVFLHVYKKSE